MVSLDRLKTKLSKFKLFVYLKESVVSGFKNINTIAIFRIFCIIDLESLHFKNKVEGMQQIVVESFKLVLRMHINFGIVERVHKNLTIFQSN